MVHVFKNAYLEYIHYMLYKITGYILINVNKHLQFKKNVLTPRFNHNEINFAVCYPSNGRVYR